MSNKHKEALAEIIDALQPCLPDRPTAGAVVIVTNDRGEVTVLALNLSPEAILECLTDTAYNITGRIAGGAALERGPLQ
jgi:hypothetical protein